MNVSFTNDGWDDFEYWFDNDEQISERIRAIIKSIKREPFRGIGKPEPLKYELKGYWSRRINQEHRLIYKIDGKKAVDQRCLIIQCRFHYR